MGLLGESVDSMGPEKVLETLLVSQAVEDRRLNTYNGVLGVGVGGGMGREKN